MRNFKDLNILVIGDIILDKYVIGFSTRLSPEAPVPVVDVCYVKDVLGGAANVANNLSSMGVNVFLCGLLGSDGDIYKKIKDLMTISDINHDGVFMDDDRMTTIKTRVMSGSQQIVRYDTEDKHEYTGDKLVNYMISLEDIDAIIISDYGKGVITNDLMWVTYISGRDVPIIVDPNINNYSYYKDRIHTITPNTKESLSFYKDDDLNKVGAKMIDYLKCENVIITKGKDGLNLYSKDKSTSINASPVKHVFDVSGAGDTLTAVFTVGIALGMSAYESASLANEAAGIVVGDSGTSVIGDRLWKG